MSALRGSRWPLDSTSLLVNRSQRPHCTSIEQLLTLSLHKTTTAASHAAARQRGALLLRLRPSSSACSTATRLCSCVRVAAAAGCRPNQCTTHWNSSGLSQLVARNPCATDLTAAMRTSCSPNGWSRSFSRSSATQHQHSTSSRSTSSVKNCQKQHTQKAAKRVQHASGSCKTPMPCCCCDPRHTHTTVRCPVHNLRQH